MQSIEFEHKLFNDEIGIVCLSVLSLVGMPIGYVSTRCYDLGRERLISLSLLPQIIDGNECPLIKEAPKSEAGTPYALFIHPENRRSGYASRLLGKHLQHAKQPRGVTTLSVYAANNPGAVNFYRSYFQTNHPEFLFDEKRNLFEAKIV